MDRESSVANQIWCHEFGQSMQRKEAYTRAYAAVLCEARKRQKVAA